MGTEQCFGSSGGSERERWRPESWVLTETSAPAMALAGWGSGVCLLG